MKHAPPTPTTPLILLSKMDLLALCDRLLRDEAAAVEQCVAFIEAETLRLWHGRARAKMARRLKHCSLAADQRDRLVRSILQRLGSGRFSEQFKDQLRLALHLDAAHVYKVARHYSAASPIEHVRRYAAWLLRHERAA